MSKNSGESAVDSWSVNMTVRSRDAI